MSFFGETEIGIVLPQNEAVFAAACHHAVGFVSALGDEIVYERSDICFMAGKDKRIFSLYFERGIDPRHESLGSCLFVTARTIDCPAE